MNPPQDNQKLVFENRWLRDPADVHQHVLDVWKQHGGPSGEDAVQRLRQLVFVIRNERGQVIGMSTAFKAYVKQLRNYFYACRLILVPDYRIPGLTSKLLVSTRDFLESIHRDEPVNPAIGLITLVENARIKEHRNEAIWPASGMVYIGNSKEGHHIRVYYFKGAEILP